MRIVLMARLKQARPRPSRAMFNDGLTASRADVVLPQYGRAQALESGRKTERCSRPTGMLPRRHAAPAKFARPHFRMVIGRVTHAARAPNRSAAAESVRQYHCAPESRLPA